MSTYILAVKTKRVLLLLKMESFYLMLLMYYELKFILYVLNKFWIKIFLAFSRRDKIQSMQNCKKEIAGNIISQHNIVDARNN